MERKKTSTAKIALWYVVSNVLVRGVAMLTTPIFTRLMTKSQYGQFSNLTSWESIITVIVTLDFTASIMRARYDFEEDMKKYMSSILLFGNIVTSIAYVIVECNNRYFEDLFAMDIRYIRALFVYLLFSPAFSYLQTEHRINGKYKFFVGYSVGSTLARTIISVFLVLLFEDKLLGRIAGYLIPMTILNIVLWCYIIFRGKCLKWTYVKYACTISIPLIPHALAGKVLASSDRIMITHYCGEEDTALYTIAYSVATIASLLWTSMNQAWAPWLFDKLNSKEHGEVKKNSKIYFGVFSLLIIGILLIAPEIVLIMGGKEYYIARYVMPPVIMGCVFQFLNGMYVNIEIYAKKTFVISVGTMIAAILNIILNYIFIPRYGYIAAAYTTLVGYAAQVVLHYISVRRISRQYSSIYDTKWLVLVTASLCVTGGVATWLYDNLVIRIMLVVVYIVTLLCMLYKYRNYIKAIIRK